MYGFYSWAAAAKARSGIKWQIVGLVEASIDKRLQLDVSVAMRAVWQQASCKAAPADTEAQAIQLLQLPLFGCMQNGRVRKPFPCTQYMLWLFGGCFKPAMHAFHAVVLALQTMHALHFLASEDA